MKRSPSTTPESRHWYVFCTKPHQEQAVNQRLQQHGITTYLPRVVIKQGSQPYFPGYLFVQADLTITGTDFFTWLPGGKGLVQFGDCPAMVPDAIITAVQQAAAAYENQAAGRMGVGTAVKIVDGPLAGYEGIVDKQLSAKERVMVLLTLLGTRTKPVTLPAAYVAKM